MTAIMGFCGGAHNLQQRAGALNGELISAFGLFWTWPKADDLARRSANSKVELY